MKVCDCFRFGNPVDSVDGKKVNIYPLHGFTNHEESWLLCEQCYTTLKEVLEDGEIK